MSLQLLINKIAENNGTALLVGGAVIDAIQNKPIKDWDIEVYNISYQKLSEILTELNLPVNLVGKAFGIIKTKIDDLELDLSIPRLENKSGKGHKGFDVILDSNLTPLEAGKRRDLTINAMYKNLHTNEIIDPYDGLSDLNNGILRATNNKTFVEDPLRVLRIMQLLPRKGKTVAPETIKLCQSIVDDYHTLPKERIFEEFKKLLLKADKPSLGLNFLKDSNWLIHFPELFNLIGCKQNPEHHPEGDVLIHTLMVVDNAAILKHNVPEDLQLAYMFAALLHDVGKPSTTNPNDLTSYGHDDAGIEIAESFMLRITNEISLIDNVKKLVGLHMRVGQLTIGKANISAWKRLHNKYRLDVLGWLSKADSNGRTDRSLDNEHLPSELSLKYFKKFGDVIKPIVNGKELIDLGWKPGIELGKYLKFAFELQMDGYKKERIIRILLRKRKKIEILTYINRKLETFLKIFRIINI
jgi:tRNA nucleotidyltransferase (CCA-adding enzyme)